MILIHSVAGCSVAMWNCSRTNCLSHLGLKPKILQLWLWDLIHSAGVSETILMNFSLNVLNQIKIKTKTNKDLSKILKIKNKNKNMEFKKVFKNLTWILVLMLSFYINLCSIFIIIIDTGWTIVAAKYSLANKIEQVQLNLFCT